MTNLKKSQKKKVLHQNPKILHNIGVFEFYDLKPQLHQIFRPTIKLLCTNLLHFYIGVK